MPDAMPPEPLSAFGLLELAQMLGVGVVQYGPNLPLDFLPKAELDRLIRCSRKQHIDIEIGAKGMDTEALARQVELAERVDSPVLRWSIDVSDAAPVCLDEVAACIQCLLPGLERRRVRLAIENSCIPAKQLRALLRSVDSSWLGVTLDTVNSLAIPEGSEEVITCLAPYVANLHIKDFVVTRMAHRMGFIVEGRPAGAGQLDVSGLLEALRGVTARTNAILELWPPEQDSLAETIALEHRWAAESVSYLRRYIPD